MRITYAYFAAISLVALTALPAMARADQPVLVASGGYLAPRFSPDGQSLLVSGSGYRGLWLLPLAGGASRQLVNDDAAGVQARFLADGRIAFRARRAGVLRDLVVDAAGIVRAHARSAPLAFAQDDRIYVRTAGQVVSVGTGDRFFAPEASPDGSRVVFVGLATGLYVYDVATGQLHHLGPGTAPSWSPDGRRVVFERTRDDGHDIVASDLWLWEAGVGVRPLLVSDGPLERRPSFSPDGTRVAFDDDRGGIYVMPLEVAR